MVRPRYINYSREVKGFRSFMDQNIRLVIPGESQTVEERSPICSPLPSLATLDPGDLSLTKNVELNSTTSARKCPIHAGPDVVVDSGDGSPPVEEVVRLASLHLQSLIKERAACEEILSRQIPGLSSSSSSSEAKEGQVEQLLCYLWGGNSD